MINIPKFEGAIRSAGLTQRILAHEMNISENTFSTKKIRGTFTIAEVVWLCMRCNINTPEDKCDIFLVPVSQ